MITLQCINYLTNLKSMESTETVTSIISGNYSGSNLTQEETMMLTVLKEKCSNGIATSEQQQICDLIDKLIAKRSELTASVTENKLQIKIVNEAFLTINIDNNKQIKVTEDLQKLKVICKELNKLLQDKYLLLHIKNKIISIMLLLNNVFYQKLDNKSFMYLLAQIEKLSENPIVQKLALAMHDLLQKLYINQNKL